MNEKPKDDPSTLSLEVIYREQRAQAGRMNETLYRMPPLFSVVIGGLWYFAAQSIDKNRVIAAGVFLFATMCAITGAFAMQRYRIVFIAYMDCIEALEGKFAPNIPPTRVRTTTMFMALLGIAAVISLLGFVYVLFRLNSN
jgi:hypothetical protein